MDVRHLGQQANVHFPPIADIQVSDRTELMRRRRVGCLVFGLCWAALVAFTFFGLAIGDPVDRNAINPLRVLFWIELGVFAAVAALFARAGMSDSDL